MKKLNKQLRMKLMADEVEFIEGSHADAEKIVKLIQQLEFETDTIQFDAAIHDYSVEQIGKNLDLIKESPTNFLLIAKYGDQPIGIVTLIETPNHEQRAELGVGVLQEYWHNGIATVLVDEAIYWASNFSWLTSIWLDVLESNQYAVHLYKKIGFKPKKSLIDDQGRKIINMELSFNQPDE